MGTPDAGYLVLIVAAAFAAGLVNAVAGGGTLLTFPALLAAGYAPVTANVTNTAALWPGYLGGAFGLRAGLDGQRARVPGLAAASLVGAAGGAAALLLLPSDVFEAATPFLLLLAAGLLAFQPWLARRLGDRAEGRFGGHSAGALAAAAGAGAYGAYFGAGVGVLFLAVLGIFVREDLRRLNSLRSLLVLLVQTLALVVFCLFGPVAWSAVVPMAAASLAGGWIGARFAAGLEPARLRATIVTVALVAAVVMFLR